MLAALRQIEAGESIQRICDQNASEEWVRELILRETRDQREADKVYGQLMIRKWAASNGE